MRGDSEMNRFPVLLLSAFLLFGAAACAPAAGPGGPADPAGPSGPERAERIPEGEPAPGAGEASAPPERPDPDPAGPLPPPPDPGPGPETRDFWEIRADMVENARAFREINPDTVGWLYLWDTTVDSPVFQRPDDNEYYLRHNDYRESDRNGAIISDFRNRLTGRESQSLNLVLYGHSKDEDPDGGVEASREFEHFTELKRWQDRTFCETHPYFLFATPEESMVFEVFAAFHTKTGFTYNRPNPTAEEEAAILTEALGKSLFDFGVEVGPSDRIMTLSTCCRRIVPAYPNGYRFVVMGRLVEKGRALEYDRTVTENPDALTPWNIYE